MKTIIWVALLFAAPVWADEAADRTAIERVVDSLNGNHTAADRERIAGLFTADARNEIDRLSNLDRRLFQDASRPWSEVTAPRIAVQSIRFIASDVALVDAANSQYGSMILVRRVPMLLVMKKVGQDWRITALRVLVDFGSY